MKTYSHAELGELARRAAAGDRTAFDRLYAATARFQYYRILQMVGSAQVAEDLLQQTYLHLWQKIAEIDPPELVAAYLSGISRNLCLQHLQRQRRQQAPLSLSGGEAANAADLGPTPQQWADKKSDVERMQAALTALTEEEREAVLLRYVQRLKVRDVAAVMGRSESTVKRLLRRAMGKLRGAMGLGGLLAGPAVARIARQSWRQAGGQGGRERASRRPSLRLLAGLAATLSALAVGTAATAPVQIDWVEWPDSVPQAQPVQVSAQVSCPAGLREIYLEGEGLRLPLSHRDGRYVAAVPRSGRYTLVARGKNGSAASREVSVTCIDDQPPVLQGSAWEEGLTVFTFADPSGVAEMYCTGEDGRRIDPVQQDLADGWFAFALPPGSYTTWVRDALGNQGRGSTRVSARQ